MASCLCLRQNMQDRVSPSEEGEQEGGTTDDSLSVVDRDTARQSSARLYTKGQVVPSSCPSPSGEGTQGKRSLPWLAYRPSRRWYLRSGRARTCRTASLPQRRENKREGQPDANAPVDDERNASQSSAGLRTNAQVRLHPLFLSFSLRRRDAGEEVSAPVGASPLPSMASWLCLRQNVPGRVSPSEEGEQEGGTTDDSLPVVDRYTVGRSSACLHTNAPGFPSSCPSPFGEGTQGDRAGSAGV